MKKPHKIFAHLIKGTVLGRTLWGANTFPTRNRLPDPKSGFSQTCFIFMVFHSFPETVSKYSRKSLKIQLSAVFWINCDFLMSQNRPTGVCIPTKFATGNAHVWRMPFARPWKAFSLQWYRQSAHCSGKRPRPRF